VHCLVRSHTAIGESQSSLAASKTVLKGALSVMILKCVNELYIDVRSTPNYSQLSTRRLMSREVHASERLWKGRHISSL
jgi:hypothetical protein